MKIIVVTNQKGGVGKSVFSTHIAMGLAEEPGMNRGLFIEFDAQGNSSKTIKKSGAKVIAQASQLFSDEPLNIDPVDGLNLIEADAKLADIERAPLDVMGYLKDQMNTLAPYFDYCVIDTPPTLGLRMTAALIVADYVLAPIELEEYSIDGITKMLQTVFGVKQKWNPDLEFLGMLPNRFNSRSEEQKRTLVSLLENYSHLLIPAKIGIRASIPEALAEGLPVWKLKKTAAREAAKEFQEAFNVIFTKMGVRK